MRIRLSELREIFQKVIIAEATGNKNLKPVFILGKTYMIPLGEYDPASPEVADIFDFRLLVDEMTSRSGMVGEFYEDLSVSVWKLDDLNEERTNERFADAIGGGVFYSIKGSRQPGERGLNKSGVTLLPLTKLILSHNFKNKKEEEISKINTISLNVGLIEWNFKKGSKLDEKLEKQAEEAVESETNIKKDKKDKKDKKEERDLVRELLESSVTLVGNKSKPVVAKLTRIEPPKEGDKSLGKWRFTIDDKFISDIIVRSMDSVVSIGNGIDLNKKLTHPALNPLFNLNEIETEEIYLPDSKLHRFTMMKKSKRRESSINLNLDAQLKIRRMQDKLANISRWLGYEEDATQVAFDDLEAISKIIDDVDAKSKKATADSKRQLKLFPEQE